MKDIRKEKKFYIVREDILPESILKTALAKEMIANGEASNIIEAVEKLDMARSTFYKYKDGVFSFFNADNLNIINISLLLRHIPGILSRVLNSVASNKGNILTINQSLPLHGVAHVSLSISVGDLEVSIDEMITILESIDGVVNVEIIGKS